LVSYVHHLLHPFFFFFPNTIVAKVELVTLPPNFTPAHAVPREVASRTLEAPPQLSPLPPQPRRSTPIFFETRMQLNYRRRYEIPYEQTVLVKL
jgi:hypothetical protein